MHSVGSLLLGAKSDGCPETDDGGLAGVLASLSDTVIDPLEIAGDF